MKLSAGSRAVQYVRMSTEHQRFSIEHQSAAIERYAREHGLQIVRSYEDRGISGLSLKGRHGLRKLLADVVGGTADFDRILVLDVSRWGRFQDPDQSAYYEFLCRQAGIAVEYCEEVFTHEHGPTAALLKSIKRVMAAEYSKELSQKVASAQRRNVLKRLWQGGPAPYGLRRALVTETGAIQAILHDGEWKCSSQHRVVLTHGPEKECAAVRRLFHLYAVTGLSSPKIASLFEAEAVPPGRAARWTGERVRTILMNEIYMGTFVAGRSVSVLGGNCRSTHQDDWRRVPGFVEPLINPAVFAAAQRALGREWIYHSDSQMSRDLADLTGATEHHPLRARALRHRTSPKMGPFAGRLSELLSQKTANGSRRSGLEMFEVLRDEGYRGSLATVRAYVRVWREARSIPVQPRNANMTEAEMLEGLRRILARTGTLNTYLIDAARDVPCANAYIRTFGSLHNAYEQIGFDRTRRQRNDAHDSLGPPTETA